MADYPRSIVPVNHVAPVPRRISAELGGETVLDTTRALYVWEHERYPQYYVPGGDVRTDLLSAEQRSEATDRGEVAVHSLRAGGELREGAARLLAESTVEGLSGTYRFEWGALDAWYEEDEQVFVHPRDPYVRVDAIRSSRRVRVELRGELLAESAGPVLVFETGLPTRCYVDRSAVDFTMLEPSDSVTECPYKGRASAWWAAELGSGERRDLAWSYEFPTRQLLPIAGLVAFYNEHTDISLDGEPLGRPRTSFS